jgi:hypothetical protein
MATLILRTEKGSPLTFEEVDNNFKALDQDGTALSQVVSQLLARTIWGNPLTENVSGTLQDVADIIGSANVTLKAGGIGNSVTVSGESGGAVILNPLNLGGPSGTVQIRNGRFFRAAGDVFASINAEALTSNCTVTLANGNTTLVPGTMVPTTGTGATGTWGISISGNVVSNDNVLIQSGGDISLVPSLSGGVISGPFFRAVGDQQGGFQGLAADSSIVPSFTWFGDPHTGIFHPGVRQVGVAAGTLEVLRFDIDGTETDRRILAGGPLEIAASGTNSSIYLSPTGNGRVEAPGYISTLGGFQGRMVDSASDASFSWVGDAGTGMYRPEFGGVGISSSGFSVVEFDAKGGPDGGISRQRSSRGPLWVEVEGDLRLNSIGGNTIVDRLIADTTASAANVYVNPTTGQLQRSTSSLRYKTDVQDAELQSSEGVVYGSRPVWYRSKAEADPTHQGYWGFIAEEVAALDPRMVQWSGGQPESVEYDRYSVHLVNVAQHHKRRLDDLEARVQALEAQG